jgi:hypothetical protein
MTFFAFSSCQLSDLCGNEVIQETQSPNKKLKAVIFSRDCGATTGTSTQLSILKADEELINEGGNTFVINEGESPGPNRLEIKIEWNNNSQVTVYFDTLARTSLMKDKVEEIEIKYKHA